MDVIRVIPRIAFKFLRIQGQLIIFNKVVLQGKTSHSELAIERDHKNGRVQALVEKFLGPIFHSKQILSIRFLLDIGQ